MQISVSSQTTLNDIANFFVFALYDASAPGVLLESQAPPKPYGNPIQITFLHNCVSGKTYIIKLWESADNTPTGTVRNSFSQTVNQNSVRSRTTEFLQVDRTDGLVNGTTQYLNDTYEGWTYTVERIGQGTLTPEDTIILSPKISIIPAGGFDLIEDGVTFQPLEEFVVRFDPQIIVQSPAGTPSPMFGAGRIITADTSLTPDDANTALLIQATLSGIVVSLPLLDAVPEFATYYFFSNGGNHDNAALVAAGTDQFQYGGANPGAIYLGRVETAAFFKFDGKWQPLYDMPGVRMVGELLYSYEPDRFNTLRCDGSILSRSQFPRLWEWVQGLEATAVVTQSAWSGTFVTRDGINYYTNKSKFHTGDGATTFGLPLLTDAMLKAIQSGAGRYEIEQVIDHEHFMFGPENNTPTGPRAAWRHNYSGAAQNYEIFGNTQTPDRFPTWVPTNQRHGSGNLVNNAGAYCLIRI